MKQFGELLPQNFVFETKAQTAFRWAVDDLFADSKTVYLWTFTMVEVMPSWHMGPTWALLQNWMVHRYAPMLGIRIFEWHTHHGLHVHMLVNCRLPISEILSYAKQLGFGRINVKRCWSVATGRYLAKYLGKDQGKIPHGGRVWARMGGVGCPANRVEYHSTELTQRKERAKAYRNMEIKPLEAMAMAKAEQDSEFEADAMRAYRLAVPNPC